MRQRTGAMLSAAVLGIAVIALFSIDGRQAKADDPNSTPNPYHVVDHWAKPNRAWGQAIGIDIDPDNSGNVFGGFTAKSDVKKYAKN